MNRTGLIIALAIAVVAGVAFALFPSWDLEIAQRAFNTATKSFGPSPPWVEFMRDATTGVIILLVLPAFLAVAGKLLFPRKRMLIPPRAAIFLIATLALGPGLMTNIVLKDYWGRTRPYGVVEFGGVGKFVPWWDPRGGCYNNCSFVAGEPSGAFWSIAPAALAPPPWRPLAYGAAIAFGIGVSVLRITAGAHFVSDAIFAGVFTFLLIWVMHGLIFRWPRTRLSDQALEQKFEQWRPFGRRPK